MSFLQVSDPTVGVDFFSKVIQLPCGTRVKLQLWDTGGQERYRSITRSYYRNTAAALIVYDVTDRQSFDNVKTWLEEIRNNSRSGPLTVIFIIGSKCDLVRKVSFNQVEQMFFLDNEICGAFEVSSKTGENVDSVFTTVASEILARIESGLLKIDDNWDGVKLGFVPLNTRETFPVSLTNGSPPLLLGEPVSNCC
jgi:Ras-related protein Rab-39B